MGKDQGNCSDIALPAQSQPCLLQVTPLPGQLCYNLQGEVLGQFCLSITWASICSVVQLVLSTGGGVSMPGVVFETAVSQQLDEGWHS